ncbi:cation efflux protein, CzcI-like [Acinetobacter ihumii]|uniref:cation efflux protein, CzcI-like n=1 Tax=Acinetobacter ihumii TaxID=2483802 RepID=UPI00148EE205|nr:cation efflux protein, CzcI-like [Acinetobacter ihumii]
MKRSVFIAMLLSVFMFQSLWNVAAAFCAHETAASNSTGGYHFGHHLDMLQQDVALQHTTQDIIKSDSVKQASVFVDHHDHLPSCLHIVIAQIQQTAQEPIRVGDLTQPVYDWANSYQSPHLTDLNPPPVLTPL